VGTPVAITRQNPRSTSRRSDGAPGDFIGDRPVNACIHPAGRPINTPTIEVLRRPVESTQYLSIRYSDRLAAAGIAGSVGSKGDSYDNAMAEALNGTYKAELVKLHRPWRTRHQLEVATIEWIDWYNHRRLHREIGLVPPAELEAHWHAQNRPVITAGTR
jgi:hypothetical protein